MGGGVGACVIYSSLHSVTPAPKFLDQPLVILPFSAHLEHILQAEEKEQILYYRMAGVYNSTVGCIYHRGNCLSKY